MQRVHNHRERPLACFCNGFMIDRESDVRRLIRAAAKLIAAGLLSQAAGTAQGAPVCKPENFKIAIDVGHTSEAPGTTSARGITEYAYNLQLAEHIKKTLLDGGFGHTILITAQGVGRSQLLKRAEHANALACGVIGAIAILVAVLTGHKFDLPSPQAVPDPALGELLYDFAALQGTGMPGAAAPAGFVPAPEPTNNKTATPSLASQPNKGCTRATWPFFDNDCLWGNADSGTQERRRKRIVARLKSPWCPGLRSNDGAFFCRSRS